MHIPRIRLRPEVPEEVRAMVPERDDRILAYAPLLYPQAGFVVAATHTLRYPEAAVAGRRGPQGVSPGGGDACRIVPWDQVLRADWSQEFLDLVIQAPSAPAGLSHRLRLDIPGQVPEVVRERVTWTILASQQVKLRPPGLPAIPALITARRSTRGGPVRWSVGYESGSEPAAGRAAAYAEQAEVAIAGLAGHLGLA